MKKINVLLMMALLLTGIAASAQTQKRNLKNELLVYILPDSLELNNPANPQKSEGNLIVRSKSLIQFFKAYTEVKVTAAFPKWNVADSIRTNAQGIKIKAPAFDRIFVFTFQSEQHATEARRSLSTQKAVLFAEPHNILVPAITLLSGPTKPRNATENKKTVARLTDPAFLSGTQWHLNNDGRHGGTVGADINAANAWGIFTGSSAVTTTIFDSGVELTHDELAGRATGDSFDPAYPVFYHATLVAGIAAANANNSKGGRGVDWGTQISSKRIWDASGYIGDSNFATMIVDAANNGSQVANHSHEGPFYSTTQALAFSYAYKMNVTSVIAMGNGPTSATKYPAGLNNVIAVGATTNTDAHASTYSNTGNHIDVTAPGGTVYAFGDSSNIYTSNTGNTYQFAVGTSYSTPVVTGLASLLKGYNLNLSNDDILNIIKITADDQGSAGWDATFGAGRVNAGNALGILQAPNSINQFTTSGGTVHATVGPYTTQFYAVPGLAAGNYSVRRHEVRKSVTFPYAFCNIVGAWGRGVSSLGFSTVSPNHGEGFTDIVPGTLTTTGATLRTYVYEAYNILGQSLGYFPTTPANAVFAYTVLGSANNFSITGGDVICSSANYSIANIGSNSVSWSVSPSGYASISTSGNAATVTRLVDGVITLTATITTSCGTKVLTKEITLGPPVLIPDLYSYNSNNYSPLLPYYTVPNNPVTDVGATVSVYFTIKGATSTYHQLTGQSSSPTITHGTAMGNTGGFFYFEFNQPNEWVSFKVTATNACGSSTYDVAFYSPEALGRYVIWPNPASTEIKVAYQYQPEVDPVKRIPKSFDVKLIDNKGKIIKTAKTEAIKSEIVIDISNLSDGTYFLHITEGKNIIKKQVIVRH